MQANVFLEQTRMLYQNSLGETIHIKISLESMKNVTYFLQ